MHDIIEFAHAHPIVAALLGGTMALSLILAGLSILFAAHDDGDEADDWRYW